MKKNNDLAILLLRKARQDATIIEKLSADKDITDDAIGFHFQQAVEKSLTDSESSHSISSLPQQRSLKISIKAGSRFVGPDARYPLKTVWHCSPNSVNKQTLQPLAMNSRIL